MKSLQRQKDFLSMSDGENKEKKTQNQLAARSSSFKMSMFYAQICTKKSTRSQYSYNHYKALGLPAS